MLTNRYQKITKKYTKTFYYSTLFFPKKLREKIFLLYSFVRIIDNFVDKKIPDKKNFYLYKNELSDFLTKNRKSNLRIINDLGKLVKEKKLQKEINDYLNIQEKEIKIKKYQKIKEFNNFIYGVAGTIGIMMAKILNLNKQSFPNAKKLGESLQIINIIRDIKEDYRIGKIYLPNELLKKYKINHHNFLKKKNRERFGQVIDYLLLKAFQLEKEASIEFPKFKKEILLPIKIAANLYLKIGEQIYQNPQLIFEKKKLKPNFFQIITIILKNIISIYVFNKKN